VLEKVMQTGKPLLIIAEESRARPWPPGRQQDSWHSPRGRQGPGFGERRKRCSRTWRAVGRPGDLEEIGLKLETTTVDLLGSPAGSS